MQQSSLAWAHARRVQLHQAVAQAHSSLSAPQANAAPPADLSDRSGNGAAHDTRPDQPNSTPSSADDTRSHSGASTDSSAGLAHSNARPNAAAVSMEQAIAAALEKQGPTPPGKKTTIDLSAIDRYRKFELRPWMVRNQCVDDWEACVYSMKPEQFIKATEQMQQLSLVDPVDAAANTKRILKCMVKLANSARADPRKATFLDAVGLAAAAHREVLRAMQSNASTRKWVKTLMERMAVEEQSYSDARMIAQVRRHASAL